MISTSRHRYFRLLLELSLLALAAWAISGALAYARAQAANAPIQQKRVGVSETGDQPLYREYKGVQIGMAASEVRRKLGEPADKSDEQDYYAFSEQEMAQIFYDKAQKVMAVSVNYLGGGGAPSSHSVLGVAIEPNEDGSVYKLLKYPKAGYWVSYSRTAGDAPMVTVVMQKF